MLNVPLRKAEPYVSPCADKKKKAYEKLEKLRKISRSKSVKDSHVKVVM